MLVAVTAIVVKAATATVTKLEPTVQHSTGSITVVVIVVVFKRHSYFVRILKNSLFSSFWLLTYQLLYFMKFLVVSKY